MHKDLLHPGERLDDLLINNLKIIQNEAEFCFSLDAVLLAHFATVKAAGRAIDLGAGTGVLGLLLAARGMGKVIGLEISPAMVAMANRSICLNGLTEQLEVRHADLRNVKGVLPAGEWELVISNPPYRLLHGGYMSPNENIARACHEVTASLQDVVAAARYLVKYRGRFAMSHLPERMAEVLRAMSEAGLEPKRLRLVYPGVDKKPSLLLVEGIRGAKPGLEILPPLFVYQENGSYSAEIMGYYPEKLPGELPDEG